MFLKQIQFKEKDLNGENPMINHCLVCSNSNIELVTSKVADQFIAFEEAFERPDNNRHNLKVSGENFK